MGNAGAGQSAVSVVKAARKACLNTSFSMSERDSFGPEQGDLSNLQKVCWHVCSWPVRLAQASFLAQWVSSLCSTLWGLRGLAGLRKGRLGLVQARSELILSTANYILIVILYIVPLYCKLYCHSYYATAQLCTVHVCHQCGHGGGLIARHAFSRIKRWRFWLLL